MLVGGIKVVGVYVWVSDNAFKNSTIMLCQVYTCYYVPVNLYHAMLLSSYEAIIQTRVVNSGAIAITEWSGG